MEGRRSRGSVTVVVVLTALCGAAYVSLYGGSAGGEGLLALNDAGTTPPVSSSSAPPLSADLTAEGLTALAHGGDSKADLEKKAEAAELRPHVVFVMLDDVGFNDMGYASSDLQPFTPFMDGLMRDGVRIDRFYGQSVCTPSRASMLTGKYPIHLQLQHWQVVPQEPWGLPTHEATMAQYLKALGYATHMVGKWHLGHYNNASTPLNRGFDSFYGFYSGGVDYLTHVSQEACMNRTDFDDDDFRSPFHAARSADDDDPTDAAGLSRHVYVKDPSTGYVWRCYRDLWDNDKAVTDAAGTHQTWLMNERAIDVLEKHESGPVFMYVSYPNAHLPLQPPHDVLKRHNETLMTVPNSDRRSFAALMLNADESLANLTNRGLKATGHYETTVLVVASDNGGQVSAMGGGSNYPLRGEKKYLFEGGVRAHAFVHSALLARDVRGATYPHLMHMSDWLPTLLEGALGASKRELGGVRLPAGVANDYASIDGVSHWHSLSKKSHLAVPRDELLLNIDYLDGAGDYLGYFRAALIIGDMKFIYNEKNISWFAPSDEYNFHLNNIHVSGRLTALYNVTDDPEERVDLKSLYPSLTKHMLKKIQKGYLPTMLESNFRAADAGCYETWDDGNYVRPWVDDARERENAKAAAALVSDSRVDYETDAFGESLDATTPRTYQADQDDDISAVLDALEDLIAGGGVEAPRR